MTDIITLLPDHIANQIAAGEVIQRPASVVKELMENSIDAGATSIQLIIKDAGRTLIKVIDDGKGMSETDARMCFERHATSKIKKIEDLFSLFTMGFRGEAMASIAAVAQVEMKTKLAEKEIGTQLNIEGSKVINQEPCSHNNGTSIAVKNLFYNVPARRNFLKSNQVETKHIIDEFIHIALSNPALFFSFHHNEMEIFHLKQGNLRQRIVSLFGKNYTDKLVPIQENTEYISIKGFVGKPDISKKTRGEQFFFVNNRFIKNNFLNHAIFKAYESLITDKSFPFYCLFIDINPAAIDINVHPTKQEIKFEDEKAVYLLLNAATKHALSQYSVTPTLDFEHESNFNELTNSNFHNEQPFKVIQSKLNNNETIKGNYNSPFVNTTTNNQADNFKNWQKLYELAPNTQESVEKLQHKYETDNQYILINSDENDTKNKALFQPIQLHNKYILTQIKSGFILIDQNKAHQRILFEKYLNNLQNTPMPSQQTLFPKTMELNFADSVLLQEILPDLKVLGFDIQPFGNNTFVLHGLPVDLANENENKLIESIIEQYKTAQQTTTNFDKRTIVAKSLAYQTAVKNNQTLDTNLMQNLIDQLFACEQPTINPAGLPTFVSYTLDDIEEKFIK